MKTVAWFSGGVSSAVAIKKIINEINEIIYIDIADQHPDTMRFLRDCEGWFGREIAIMQHPVYASIGQFIRKRRFINGPKGAACSKVLKVDLRVRWEFDQVEPLRYVWGMDAREENRADGLIRANPNQDHVFPLIDLGIGKTEAHEILNASGITRPMMYDMGYHNNNCIGCVKGGMGYWNKIRVDFPEVFADRAAMEREIGRSCINGTFLDELDPDAGRHDPPITDECGLFCEYMRLS